VSTTARQVTDAERRARLVARHHLARTATGPTEAVRAVVALHSSDPLTPYLAIRARVPRFVTADLDRALFEERSLCRLHAMRRTLFVVPRDEVAVFEAAAARDVARRERKRLEGWLAAEMEARSVPAFLENVERRVLEELADAAELSTRELGTRVPELATPITLGSGRWVTRSPLSSRLLFLMAMDGRIVRTRPLGSWRSSQYRWATAETWLEEVRKPADPAAARLELARRYLAAHGPATLADLRWWTGWTARQTAAALESLDLVRVRLDSDSEGLLLYEDAEPIPPAPPHATFLPGLDPTPMGWTERAWFLGDHATRLFDRNGNAGPTVWVDGRVVGGWARRPDGEVAFRLLEDVGREDEIRIAEEAAALTAWLDGIIIAPRFPTPLEREIAEAIH
jgi:hypothetical protein